MIYRLCSVIIFISIILSLFLFILNSLDDGPIGPRGINGDKGDKGSNGSKGAKGIQGPRGPLGDKGEENLFATIGPQGLPGPKGPQGFLGARGKRGDVGEKGNKGDPGEQGFKGNMGKQGQKGVKGLSGDDNKLKFILNDESNYENEVELETTDSTVDNDYYRPLPGTIPGFNEAFNDHKTGIPLNGINKNLNWSNFVTGYKLKGDSLTNDRAKGYYTNIQIIVADSK